MENLDLFIGKTIKEAVELVRNEKSRVNEFAVATKKGSDVIEKVSFGSYLMIAGAKGMDEYIIETNAQQEKIKRRNIAGKIILEDMWKKTEKGYHKILERGWVGTGYWLFNQEETVPTIERDLNMSKINEIQK